MGFVIFIHMSLLDTYEEIIESGEANLPITGDWLIELGFKEYKFSSTTCNPTYIYRGDICGSFFELTIKQDTSNNDVWKITFRVQIDTIYHDLRNRSDLLKIYGKELGTL